MERTGIEPATPCLQSHRETEPLTHERMSYALPNLMRYTAFRAPLYAKDNLSWVVLRAEFAENGQ